MSKSVAKAKNLTHAGAQSFVLRADATTRLSASGPGRNSVRLQSKAAWATHVAIFDVRHMPQGCGCVRRAVRCAR